MRILLTICLMVGLMGVPVVQAEIIEYTDENGKVKYTNNPDSIPKKYRESNSYKSGDGETPFNRFLNLFRFKKDRNTTRDTPANEPPKYTTQKYKREKEQSNETLYKTIDHEPGKYYNKKINYKKKDDSYNKGSSGGMKRY